MAINVYWHDEQKTIIRIDYVGAWSLDEFYHKSKEASRMADEVNHPVDYLVDMRQSIAAPTKLLSTARYLNELAQPNQGLTVSVGVPSFIKALVKVATRIAPKVVENLHYVDTLDQAFEIIRQQAAKGA